MRCMAQKSHEVQTALRWDDSGVSRFLSGSKGIVVDKIDPLVAAVGFVCVTRKYLDAVATLSFHPSKTVNGNGVRLLIEMTPDLRETLDRARGGKITSIGPVICTHAGGRFTYIGAYSGWKRACERARSAYEKDCEENGSTPDPKYLIGMHFHDLRAKALTDLKRQRGAAAAQSLAGHTTESMTAHYTKSREVERVRPVPLKRAS